MWTTQQPRDPNINASTDKQQKLGERGAQAPHIASNTPSNSHTTSDSSLAQNRPQYPCLKGANCYRGQPKPHDAPTPSYPRRTPTTNHINSHHQQGSRMQLVHGIGDGLLQRSLLPTSNISAIARIVRVPQHNKSTTIGSRILQSFQGDHTRVPQQYFTHKTVAATHSTSYNNILLRRDRFPIPLHQ